MSIENPQNKNELIDHCLILLGQPVISINVTKQQCELKIKQAIKKFVDYDYASTETAWVRHEITNENRASKEFIVPDSVLEVRSVMGIRRTIYNGLGGVANNSIYMNIFNNMNRIHYTGFNKVDMYLYQREVSEMENLFSPPEIFHFNTTSKKLSIEINSDFLGVGQFIVYQADISLEKIEGDFWSNDWLIRYATALIQEQWGDNLGKFEEITLPGGAKMNGNGITDKAEKRKAELLEELYENASLTQAQIVFG